MSLGFPTTYIINLERAEDKRAHAEQNISKYTDRYEFFNAVDGRALNVAQIGQYYDAALNQKLGKRPLSKPEIGCYLSHIGVWTEIVARQDETALILEDDFDFQFDPREFFDEMNKLDLRRVIVKIDASRTRGVVRSRCEAGKFCLVANDIIGPRTTGYILGRDAAISLLVSNSRFFRPIDNDLKHLWEHTVPIFTALPAMVAEMKGAASVSALAHDRSMAKPADILARFVRNLRYQINFRRGRARNKLAPVEICARRDPKTN